MTTTAEPERAATATAATDRITIALGEYDIGWHDPAASIAAADRLVERVAAVGVDLVVLPEMSTTGFTMDSSRAVSLDSPDVAGIRQIATRHRVWVIAGVAARAAGPQSPAVNAALAINPSGEIVATHFKRRLFAYSGEDKSYTSGDKITTVEIDGVRIGMFICYELRFPEVFAPVAASVDAMVVIANWPSARQEHWDTLLRARAIENQCFVIGVNRTGTANGLAYSGGSVVYDAWGDRVSSALTGGVRVATIQASHARDIRARYPFLRDRQV
jgi:predicted amidohydrolase